ncbi:MAG TPA: hypothetical protein VMV29_00305 [Ktedonobacterales bacterium]|nr:hypothetical protein [Ktedonobacterales bacterium]
MSSYKQAGRAYVIEFGGAMAAYVVVLIVAITILNANPHAAWRPLVALAPVIPACFAVLAFVRFLRRMDELQRRIQLEAIGLSFAVSGILTFAYGFLEMTGFPHLSLIWIFPGMIMLWGLGLAIASRRYQ